MQRLRSNLNDAALRYGGDNATLCLNLLGLAVAVFSTRSSRQQMHVRKQNIGTSAAHRDDFVALHQPITNQPAPTIPIALQLNPAVSYLEAC